MWDYDHNTLPKSLNSLFTKTKSTHSHRTRFANADKLTIDKVNSHRYGDMSFKVIGATKLNELKDFDFYNDARTKKLFLDSLKNNILDTYQASLVPFYMFFVCLTHTMLEQALDDVQQNIILHFNKFNYDTYSFLFYKKISM